MYRKLTRWFDDNLHKYVTTMLLLVGLLYVVAHSFGPYVGIYKPPTSITTPTPTP